MGFNIVKVKQGQLQGVEKENCTLFAGVPFAKPPIGELRFKAPEEPESWEGIRVTDHFAKTPVQFEQNEFYQKELYDDPNFQFGMDEDCLYLNIWTPAVTGDEKLPVAFWIHGGGFMNGFSSEMEFDGAEYCKRGVILVTCTYRLSALGFLVHPLLMEENERGIAGNYGILDQIAALNWVYENIARFGGDPSNITVYGQSAGAMSTQVLMSSPLTGDKIHQVILQSGGGYQNGFGISHQMKEYSEVGEAFVKACGVSSLEELRALPWQKIREATAAIYHDSSNYDKGLPFQPVIDGYVLPDGCDRRIETGEIKKISYLLGSTADDLMVTPEMKQTGDKGPLFKGCIDFTHILEKQTGEAAYVYYLKTPAKGDDAGAYHSFDLWYTFGTLDRNWRPKDASDYAISERMLDYWTNFMRSGNPNGTGLAEWKPCKTGEDFVMEF